MVGAGGCIGSLMRYGMTLLTQGVSISFPYGTLSANLLGCLLVGMIMQLAVQTDWLTSDARLFLATGVCGGFTTLSSTIYELMQFFRSGEWGYASFYLVATVLGCVLTFVLGALLVKAVIRV